MTEAGSRAQEGSTSKRRLATDRENKKSKIRTQRIASQEVLLSVDNDVEF
jgi:hypothetical protein